MGIEPTSSAWKAEVLPLNYTRLAHALSSEISVPENRRLLPSGGGGIYSGPQSYSGHPAPRPSGPPRPARRSKSLPAIS